jgi:hypothetical protein
MPAILLLAGKTKILAFVFKAGFETPSSLYRQNKNPFWPSLNKYKNPKNGHRRPNKLKLEQLSVGLHFSKKASNFIRCY